MMAETITGGAMEAAGAANLDVFAKTLEELAGENRNIVVVTSDSRGSGKLTGFASRYPERIVEVGIAEQHLVGMAAGLAAGGKNVFAVSPASFLTARSLEQIKHDICYSERPVCLVGISAGVSYGALGSTHHSLHDFAALRAIHNIIVAAPSDNWEAEQAVRAAAESEFPVYLRFGKKPLPALPNATDFFFAKGRELIEGTDGLFVTTGETAWRALKAAAILAETGASIGVVNMHTIKPLDEELLLEKALVVSAVVVAEEHSIYGGLAEACGTALFKAGVKCKFAAAGIPDEYTVTGSQEEILSHYGISAEGLAGMMQKVLERS
jgi:transketolase